MRFSVVEIGYDQREVDSCLDDLDVQLARLAERVRDAASVGPDLESIRREAERLRGLLGGRPVDGAGPTGRQRSAPDAEAQAAEILAQARSELSAAREEARLLRERVYAEALQARRDFEAALHARRRREARLDEILRGTTVVPADTPTAAAGAPMGGVPATRSAATPADTVAE